MYFLNTVSMHFLNPSLVVKGILYSLNRPLVPDNKKYFKYRHCGMPFLHSDWKWLKNTASKAKPHS